MLPMNCLETHFLFSGSLYPDSPLFIQQIWRSTFLSSSSKHMNRIWSVHTIYNLKSQMVKYQQVKCIELCLIIKRILWDIKNNLKHFVQDIDILIFNEGKNLHPVLLAASEMFLASLERFAVVVVDFGPGSHITKLICGAKQAVHSSLYVNTITYP